MIKIRIMLMMAMGAIMVLVSSCNDKVTIAYVEPGTVYSGYAGKAYYDSLYSQEVSLYKADLDSMAVILKGVLGGIEAGDTTLIPAYKQLEKKYYQKNQTYQEKEEELRNKYIEELWKRINSVIGEYGRSGGYTYILGADGSGGIMYADTTLNITEDVLQYINADYKQNPYSNK